MFARLIVIALAGFASAGLAIAQNISLSPIFGTVSLSAGFTPDPHVVVLSAGGGQDASQLGGDCRGFMSQAPDVRLHYTAGTTLPLIISTSSPADTTLVINGPDGRWYCDDDSGNGLNAPVRFAKPSSGQYDIWVGTYSSSGLQSAQLQISELHSQ